MTQLDLQWSAVILEESLAMFKPPLPQDTVSLLFFFFFFKIVPDSNALEGETLRNV